MPKSFDPLMPKASNVRPIWMDRTDGFVRYTKVQTDDADFGICFTPRSTARVRPLAWKDGRGKWREVMVDWKRVREAT
jgi:hypothetical protein